MPMDWEYFFKHGYNPAVKTFSDYLDYGRDVTFSQQQHRQRLTENLQKHRYGLGEIGVKHGIATQEEEQAFGHRVELKQIEMDIKQHEDALTRGIIDYEAITDLDVARKKAGINLSRTAAEEKIRFDYRVAGYDKMANVLRGNYKNNPAAALKSNIQSLNQLIESQSTLNFLKEGAVESSNNYNTQYAAEKDPRSPRALELMKMRDAQLLVVQRYDDLQEGLNTYIGKFNQKGIFPEGPIPEDKQKMIIQAVVFWREELGLDPGGMTVEELMAGLHSTYPGIEFTPNDAQFILANMLESLKGGPKEEKK